MSYKSSEEITVMGMFDWVRCEVPLPDGFVGELQTKDFDDPFLLTHVISKDGRLLKCTVNGVEIVPEPERPYPDRLDIGRLRIKKELHDANFHGSFSFGAGSSHNYIAEFNNGNLVRIRFEQDTEQFEPEYMGR